MKFRIRRASNKNLNIEKLSEIVRVIRYEKEREDSVIFFDWAEIEVNSFEELQKISRLYDDELIIRFDFLRYANNGNEILVYDDYIE